MSEKPQNVVEQLSVEDAIQLLMSLKESAAAGSYVASLTRNPTDPEQVLQINVAEVI